MDLIKFLNAAGLGVTLVDSRETLLAKIFWIDSTESIKKLRSIIEDLKYKFKCQTISVEPDVDKGAIRIVMCKSGIKYIDKTPVPEHELQVLLGEGIDGPIVHDFKRNPHLLIAGTTGSGKSKLLCGILDTLVVHNNVILVPLDYKGTELKEYHNGGLPIFQPELFGISELKTSTKIILKHIVTLMENRFKEKELGSFFPIFVIVDELSDIMDRSNPEDKEEYTTMIRRIAQMGRAAKIHLILCTQYPKAEVIDTGIKANITTRVALKTATSVESRVILDENGSEDLDVGSFYYMNSKKIYGKVYRYVRDARVIPNLAYRVPPQVEEPPEAAVIPTKVEPIEPPEVTKKEEEERWDQNVSQMMCLDSRFYSPDDFDAEVMSWKIMGPVRRAAVVQRSLDKLDRKDGG